MDELRASLRHSGRAATAAGCVIALFLLTPLIVILPIALSGGQYLTFPPPGLSARWFSDVFGDPDWRASFTQSLKVASVATLLAVLAGTSAAFALRRARRLRRVLRTAMIAPLVIPQLVLALGLYLAVGDLGGTAGVRTLMLGQAALATPMVYLTVAAGLSAVDPAVSRAALSLGHRWPSVLVRIELPLVGRSIAGATVLAFGLCFDESVLSYYLSPPGQETLPTHLWLSASQSASPAIAAVSSLVMGLAVILLGISLVLTGTRRKS
ncbi:MAG: binding-protein-dependent transport system inner rane component [Streptosporangiaceae bacterium]|jgi:putative spermidine/putrescine transport system permease protein|nr:binding-protein-dependent transport system inner rane component [Streptosporangiaceae bacterium]